jgi:hypothetical protein
LICCPRELNRSARARWLKLFPHVAPPDDDPQVARVLLNKRLAPPRRQSSRFQLLNRSQFHFLRELPS